MTMKQARFRWTKGQRPHQWLLVRPESGDPMVFAVTFSDVHRMWQLHAADGRWLANFVLMASAKAHAEHFATKP